MVEHEAVIEMGAAGADLLERGVEDAELDDGSGGDGLVCIDRHGSAGGEVVRVEGDFAVEAGDPGLEGRGEGRVVLRERGGKNQEGKERESEARVRHGGTVASTRHGLARIGEGVEPAVEDVVDLALVAAGNFETPAAAALFSTTTSPLMETIWSRVSEKEWTLEV